MSWPVIVATVAVRAVLTALVLLGAAGIAALFLWALLRAADDDRWEPTRLHRPDDDDRDGAA